MENPLLFSLTRRTYLRILLTLLAACAPVCRATAQEAPAKPETPQAATPANATPVPAAQSPAASTPANDSSEVSTRDTPPTFRVRVNLVLVRVVVRDATGKVVTNLKKEDFQLSDNRKPQVITTFSAETPESHRLESTTKSADPNADGGESAAAIAALPQRFVAVVFDDTDMLVEDTVWVRGAATRLFSSLAPTDRVGIYSTSGQVTQEFTQNHELLQNSLLSVVPRPLTANGNGIHDCPDISYYQADMIENKRDAQALQVATEDALQCAFEGERQMIAQAQMLASNVSQRVLSTGDSQTEYVYRHLEDMMKRLGGMPGQRVMVFISPGFIITNMLSLDSSSAIDRANRANIVINTIDARGLYTPDLLGDISDPPRPNPKTGGILATYRLAAQSAQTDILGILADGTGGTFFHNRNDIDEGLREAAAAPAMSYLLGFSPQNLKPNGAYHTLKVSLTGKQKLNIQARHGYYAPRTITDPVEAAKEEIQEALFSQDEIHDLPVELQTQFFKKDQSEARLAVLTHVDVKGIRFRKADGRNRDDLTVATAIFDENGNYVIGGQKIVEMKLLDTTFNRLSRSGFTLKSSFDVKPGTYLVRLVVRDAEGAQMAARNGAVSIPY
jgi:VWFA-related protein